MITPRQIRAARALLGWEAVVLAEKAGVTKEAISRIEGEKVRPHESTLAKILRAFNDAGVEFTPNTGVQLKPQNVEVLEGTPGFLRFYDCVYEHLSAYGGKVCVSGVNERLFVKYQGDFADVHMDRMAELVKRRDDILMRILVKEGDYNFVASKYAQYRWQPKQYFSPAPFYVFGDNLALISFTHDPSPLVIFIKSANLAEAYKHSFDLAWEHAIDPPPQKTKGAK